MPTAVMTESSENTMSTTAIWAMTLQNRAAACRLGRALLALLALLDGLEDLARCLVEQEQPAAQQHQVAPAEGVAGDREQLGRQAHDPAERQQQRDARDHRERQAGAARLVALCSGEPAHQDGQEDDVVDAQHDLEGREHPEGDPQRRVEQQFHGGLPVAGGQRTVGNATSSVKSKGWRCRFEKTAS
jgi:hypothetical protein